MTPTPPNAPRQDAVAQAAEDAKRLMVDYCQAVLTCAERATDQNVKAVARAESVMYSQIDALAALAQPSVEAPAAVEVTEAMVTTYLEANDAYWRKTDELPKRPGRWREGTSREATAVSLKAALASQASTASKPGEAVATVPVPVVDSYAGGANPDGLAAWLRVRLGDSPEITNFIREDLVSAFPLEVHTGVQSERINRYFANQIGEHLHPKTLTLVLEFLFALGRKLAAAERKYGYSDGWAANDWEDECRAQLHEHVAKGDPRDVAAYCAFMWFHGWSTAAATPSPTASASEPRLVSAPLPHPGGVGISALLDSILAEYNWPSNPKNAARAGWTAAMRYLAATPSPAPNEVAGLCGITCGKRHDDVSS